MGVSTVAGRHKEMLSVHNNQSAGEGEECIGEFIAHVYLFLQLHCTLNHAVLPSNSFPFSFLHVITS